MRRIVAFDNVSADGYFAGPDGGLGWVVHDPELDRWAMQGGEDAALDTILFGRRTYEQFASFWPHALDGTVANPHGGGGLSPEMRKMAVVLNEANKIVFSRTQDEVTWKNSRLVRELDPREVEAIKREPGADIMIFGSGSIVSQLTEHGLIDEYQFVVNPVLLGSGQSLVRDVPRWLRLELLEAKAFPSGNVLLRYARAET